MINKGKCSFGTESKWSFKLKLYNKLKEQQESLEGEREEKITTATSTLVKIFICFSFDVSFLGLSSQSAESLHTSCCGRRKKRSNMEFRLYFSLSVFMFVLLGRLSRKLNVYFIFLNSSNTTTECSFVLLLADESQMQTMTKAKIQEWWRSRKCIPQWPCRCMNCCSSLSLTWTNKNSHQKNEKMHNSC